MKGKGIGGGKSGDTSSKKSIVSLSTQYTHKSSQPRQGNITQNNRTISGYRESGQSNLSNFSRVELTNHVTQSDRFGTPFS